MKSLKDLYGHNSKTLTAESLRKIILEEIYALLESDGVKSKNYSKDSGLKLKQWFDKGGWVQTGGEYDGKPCAKQPGQKTKPYCRDPDDRKSMSKKERDKRARKKRKEDPNPDRKGKAKNVSQK